MGNVGSTIFRTFPIPTIENVLTSATFLLAICPYEFPYLIADGLKIHNKSLFSVTLSHFSVSGVTLRASGTRSMRTSSKRRIPGTTCRAPTLVRTPSFTSAHLKQTDSVMFTFSLV